MVSPAPYSPPVFSPRSSTAQSRSPPRSTRIPLRQGTTRRVDVPLGSQSHPAQNHTPTSSTSHQSQSHLSSRMSSHQIPHPPSPPDTIRSSSPPPGPHPSRLLHGELGPGGGDEDELREIAERERTHERILGGIGGISSVKALAERERKSARRQSLTYSFSTPTNRLGLDPKPRPPLKKWLVLVVPPDALPHSPPPTQVSLFFAPVLPCHSTFP